MKLTLIITTFNWPESLFLVIDSIRRQSILPDEVIIAEYYTIEEADDHMESIKSQSPKAHKHHYIKEK